MIGVGGWGRRNEHSGPYVRWRDGKIVRDTGPGRGGSHGRRHEFALDVRDPGHPIMQGLPARFLHCQDELYDRLRGPAENLTVLATAFSDEATGGSGEHEPLLMAIDFGKGRCFHTALGQSRDIRECGVRDRGRRGRVVRHPERRARRHPQRLQARATRDQGRERRIVEVAYLDRGDIGCQTLDGGGIGDLGPLGLVGALRRCDDLRRSARWFSFEQERSDHRAEPDQRDRCRQQAAGPRRPHDFELDDLVTRGAAQHRGRHVGRAFVPHHFAERPVESSVHDLVVLPIFVHRVAPVRRSMHSRSLARTRCSSVFTPFFRMPVAAAIASRPSPSP